MGYHIFSAGLRLGKDSGGKSPSATDLPHQNFSSQCLLYSDTSETIGSIMQIPLIRLQCGVNSYDWGKVGKDSAAAKFAAATPADDFTIQDDKPYAEVLLQSSAQMHMLIIHSYGWEPTLPIHPKTSKPNELFST
jgi:hypothetical protein